MRSLTCSSAPSIWAADPPNLSPGPPAVTMIRDAVIVATARTPMGRYGGQLKDVRPDDLAAIVLKEVCERAHVKPYEVSSEDQDEFALRSHQRAIAAQESGRLAEEIVPVVVQQRKGEPIRLSSDEGPRPDSSLEALARLRPAFAKDGSV